MLQRHWWRAGWGAYIARLQSRATPREPADPNKPHEYSPVAGGSTNGHCIAGQPPYRNVPNSALISARPRTGRCRSPVTYGDARSGVDE
jgi:hypothetical protein